MYPNGNLLIRPLLLASFLLLVSLLWIFYKRVYKEMLGISRWTAAALWSDSSVTGWGGCCEPLWICSVCHHLSIRLLPLLSLRWRGPGSKAAEATVFVGCRGADLCWVTNILASRCLSSADILGLSFCPLGRSRESAVGKGRLRWVHISWPLATDTCIETAEPRPKPGMTVPSTVKGILFITSERPSICGRFLFTTSHVEPPPI